MPIPSRHRLAGSAAAVLALILTGAGCAAPAGDAGTTGIHLSTATPAARGDIDGFTWALYAEPPVLDYLYAFDYPQNTVLANVCESLMRWTPQLTVEPGLAEKASNPDPTTWVYDLRPNVRFHSGATLTADDAVASLNRHLDPELGSYWAEDFKNVASVEKTGPLQVTVHLKAPDALFPQAMANSAGTVANAATMREQGRRFGTADGGLDCTGPFTLGKWEQGASLRLDRFDGYRGKRAKAATSTSSSCPTPPPAPTPCSPARWTAPSPCPRSPSPASARPTTAPSTRARASPPSTSPCPTSAAPSPTYGCAAP